MSLAQECMNKFDKRKLKELGELEQDMATGLNNDGKQVVPKALKAQLTNMCQDPSVSALDKLRLLMIYIISQGGIQDATRNQLMKDVHADLQKAIRNLEKLGVDLTSINNNNKSKHSKERLAEFAKRNKTIPLALMRYLPSLHATLENLVTGDLDEEAFPYTSPPPAADRKSMANKSSAAKSARRKGDWKSSGKDTTENKEGDEDSRPRLIIFVLGGLTFSEMRSAYEIAEQRKANLYIGSTSTLTSKQYIRDLSQLKRVAFRETLKQASTASVEELDNESDSERSPGGEITDEDFNKMKLEFK